MSKVKKKTNTKKQNSTTPINETTAPAEATKTTATTVEKAQTKQSIIVALLSQEGGTTLEELIKATEWQPHSVRGHLSNLRKKRGMPIETFTNTNGVLTYSLKNKDHH
jgi:predicted ArsR family transcriptional regulator